MAERLDQLRSLCEWQAEKIAELEEDLSSARQVIRFYAHRQNWTLGVEFVAGMTPHGWAEAEQWLRRHSLGGRKA